MSSRQSIRLHVFLPGYSPMHEFNVCQSIIDSVKEHVTGNGRSVKKTIVVIGALRPIVSEYLTFAYAYLTKGTVAEGSELIIKRPHAQGKCSRCGTKNEVADTLFRCGQCGETKGEIFGGRELYIDYIELHE